MANYLTDDAICLRVTDFSETSQIVALFTRRHGLVPLIAKGSKRASQRNTMSGPLDLLTSGEVVFVPARERAIGIVPATHGVQLGTLTGWELANPRRELRGLLPALHAAMLTAEITTHLVHPHDPHEELFLELDATLDMLPVPAHRARIAVAYVKAALVSAGYWPNFATCLECGRGPSSPDEPVRYFPRAGGIVCSGCQVQNLGACVSIPTRIAVALDRLSSPAAMRATPPERPADESALAAAMEMLLAQVESITDKPLRTRQILGTIFTARLSP
jgi:DNA repair protein RecO (recombination protein O)